MRNCVRIEQIPDPISPISAILRRCPHSELRAFYGIPSFENATDFLVLVAQRRGKIRQVSTFFVSACANETLKCILVCSVALRISKKPLELLLAIGTAVPSNTTPSRRPSPTKARGSRSPLLLASLASLTRSLPQRASRVAVLCRV